MRAHVGALFDEAGARLPAARLERVATDVARCAAEGLEGNALLAKTGALFNAAADEAGGATDVAADVAAIVGRVLVGVGAHLPYISACTGVLGALYDAFRESKIADRNVENVRRRRSPHGPTTTRRRLLLVVVVTRS